MIKKHRTKTDRADNKDVINKLQLSVPCGDSHDGPNREK